MPSFLRWDEVFDTDLSNRLLNELASLHLSRVQDKGLRTYFSLLLYERRYAEMLDYEPQYEQLSLNDAIQIRQILAFFTKRKDLDLGIDKEAAAFTKFVEAEQLCAETNHVFSLWERGGFHFPSRVESVLYRAQCKISQILGDVPSLDTLRLRFGPGATTQVKRKNASARMKLSQMYTCSEELSGYVSSVLEELPGWIPFKESDTLQVPVQIHDGNLSFVAKSAKIFRAIVIEPMLNSMVQLGIGDYMAQRLQALGRGIKDQSVNQKRARIGSLTGELATLDLSSASDTVASGLVRHLLPVDWYLFLSKFRTGTVCYKGSVLKLQKFSSMGNGYTFGLETIIFLSLALGVCQSRAEEAQVSVYGDDIIVPTERYELLCEVLHHCGFIPNREKSFARGPFRESCGADYYRGIDIRPVYVKDRLSCSSSFVLHNFYARRFDDEATRIIRGWFDPSVILEGPDGYGDGHLIVPDPQRTLVRSQTHVNRGWGGYTFDTYTWKSRDSFRPLPGDYVYPCYSIYVQSKPAQYDHVVSSAIELTPDRIMEVCGCSCNISHRHSKKTGSFGVTLPGTKGYKVISIYTF